jgi:hypothetical protein
VWTALDAEYAMSGISGISQFYQFPVPHRSEEGSSHDISATTAVQNGAALNQAAKFADRIVSAG